PGPRMRPAVAPLRPAFACLLLATTVLAGCSQGPSSPVAVSAPDVVLHSSFGDKAVAAREGLPPVVRFADVHTGYPGGEPNIGVTPSGTVFATAYETIVRSVDGGRSFQPSYRQRLGFTNDPMLWVDEQTGRVFSPQQFPKELCSSQVFSDDEGRTWLEKPLTCGIPLVDHQKIASGPHTGPLAGAGVLHPRLVSYCYNKPHVGTHCAVSHDGGVTFSLDRLIDPVPGSRVPAGELPPCGGLNGHQRHGHDGTIVLPYGYECKRARAAVSTDGGLTWTLRDLGERNRELDPEVASTPDGTWYYLYRGDDNLPYLLRSRDRFATTEGPFAVAPPGIAGTMFLGLVAGSDGRIAVSYLANTRSSLGPDDVPRDTAWHLYVGFSLNADARVPTFLTSRVNPEEDPVQRGTICMDKPCLQDPGASTTNRNLLDFIDMAVAPDGRVYVAYADGCTSRACLAPDASPRSSRSDELTVAWVLEGPGLFGPDVKPPPR
ncbi:MAG TPA: hypothetical protein VFH47_03945, partial [Candidatus Thermoplasmatota archaeon]|nr:hypothetical protein [Candidatus Thermoplasmatota archaeon]